MPKGVNTSKQLKERVLEAFHNGELQAEISRRFVIPRYTVCRILQNSKEREHLDDILKTGRPRKSSLTTDRLIKRISQNDPWKSAPHIKSEIENFNLSTRSVQRRLVEAKLFGRRPARKPLISKKNKTARLELATEHVGWNREDWQKILFSDETKYDLFKSDGTRWVRRPMNERFNEKYIAPTVKHGGGNVMLWGCFSYHGVGPLQFIDGNMDRFHYRDILNRVMLPYAEWNMPLRFVFQHDNDPKHASLLVREWLQENLIRVMMWPSQSPDLNPISIYGKKWKGE
jgi:hypothetical protein